MALSSPSTFVGSTAYLIDKVVSCATFFFTQAELVHLLPVSKLWFELAAKYLWGKHATWVELQQIVCDPVGEVSCISLVVGKHI